ncbi:hypothetical protein KPH14_001061 [Odynerus spinipes]|uniref:PiggyBac transposable element-derived protein domain-containing protein n=1 Tax=Odynerus spinipes TaxID=1348599 RepID=A0AAD9REW5_9HYME|nr:hypothetical protein KPH14_001061 [Odynerus spinipes]
MVRSGERSVEERLRICELRKEGYSLSSIANLFKISKVGVKKICDRIEERGNAESLSRTGRKRKTTPRQDNHIVREAKKNPLITTREIKENLELPIGLTQIKQHLREAGLHGRAHLYAAQEDETRIAKAELQAQLRTKEGRIRRRQQNLEALDIPLTVDDLHYGPGIDDFINGILMCSFREKKSQRNPVILVSTNCTTDNVVVTKKRQICESEKTKPSVIHNYNKFMGGVDKADKMLYTYLDERRTMKYWKKVAFSIIGRIVLNAYIIYSENNKGSKRGAGRGYCRCPKESSRAANSRGGRDKDGPEGAAEIPCPKRGLTQGKGIGIHQKGLYDLSGIYVMPRGDERITVAELHKFGMKTADIVRTTGFKQRTVYKIVKCLKETGGTMDRPRSGRPITVTTPENINKVRWRIRRNSEVSMRRMAKNLGINRESVRNIVEKKLKLRSYKIARVHFLNEAMKAKRLEKSRSMGRLVASRRMPKIRELTPSERSQIFNRRMRGDTLRKIAVDFNISAEGVRKLANRLERNGTAENLPKSGRPRKTTIRQDRIIRRQMLKNRFIFAEQLKSELFLPIQETQVRMRIKEAGFYGRIARKRPLIKDDFSNYLEDIPLQQRIEMWFQLDGCPAHYSRAARSWLNINYPQRWIGRGGIVPWPPRSPDMTPMDFFVWGLLKQEVYSVPINSK